MSEPENDPDAIAIGIADNGRQTIWYPNDDRHLILGTPRSGHTAGTVDP